MNLAAFCETGGNNILRDVAAGISCTPVNLGWVFSGKSSAAMTRHAAVGINNNLSAGQATIADGTANNEVTGRINKVLGSAVKPVFWQHGFDDFFHDRFLKVLKGNIRRMLGRQYDRINGNGIAIGIVPERNLAFCVGSQERQFP